MARVMATCMDVMDRPWQWGAADCCTAACDVFLRLYGVDPMLPLRGRYSTRMGALRIIGRMGGMMAMADDLAARAGLVESDGSEGDIGVICFDGQLALGICTGAIWQGKSERGMAPVRQFARAWRAA